MPGREAAAAGSRRRVEEDDGGGISQGEGRVTQVEPCVHDPAEYAGPLDTGLRTPQHDHIGGEPDQRAPNDEAGQARKVRLRVFQDAAPRDRCADEKERQRGDSRSQVPTGWLRNGTIVRARAATSAG